MLRVFLDDWSALHLGPGPRLVSLSLLVPKVLGGDVCSG
jgi:hypothetical protein